MPWACFNLKTSVRMLAGVGDVRGRGWGRGWEVDGEVGRGRVWRGRRCGGRGGGTHDWKQQSVRHLEWLPPRSTSLGIRILNAKKVEARKSERRKKKVKTLGEEETSSFISLKRFHYGILHISYILHYPLLFTLSFYYFYWDIEVFAIHCLFSLI